MTALGIDMTTREPVTGWEALAPQKAKFPLTPEDVRAIRTPEMTRIANEIKDLEQAAWDSLQCGLTDDYLLLIETAGILFEHLKVMTCVEFVRTYEPFQTH